MLDEVNFKRTLPHYFYIKRTRRKMKRTLLSCVLFLASLALFGKTLTDHRVIKTVSFSGKVIHDETQAPVVSKLTVILKDFTTLEITTNSNGEFLVTIPETNECKLLVRADGFESQDDVVQLAPNASHYIEIHLVPYVKLILDGEILNSKDNQPIKAELKVYHNSDFEKEDDKMVFNGKCSEPLINYGWYIIDVSAKGFVDAIDTLWVLSCSRKTVHKKYELTPIEAGLTVQLKNIYFTFGKATLSSDSYVELNLIAELFKNNPTMKAEIAGHTDSDGPDDYNLFLSQIRAEEVARYLKEKGVNENQIIAKGYGETKPIDTNATRSGKANNRRVEMVVIKE